MVGSRLQELPGVLDELIATAVEKVRILTSPISALFLSGSIWSSMNRKLSTPFALLFHFESTLPVQSWRTPILPDAVSIDKPTVRAFQGILNVESGLAGW